MKKPLASDPSYFEGGLSARKSCDHLADLNLIEEDQCA